MNIATSFLLSVARIRNELLDSSKIAERIQRQGEASILDVCLDYWLF